MNSAFRTTFVRRILPLSLLGLLLVVAMSCNGKGGCAASERTARMIKEETGIDLSSPADAIKVGVGGQTQGNKDEESALDTVAGALKRAKHQKQGDELRIRYDYVGARKEYAEAIKWTKTNTNAGKDRKAHIINKIGLTHRSQAADYQLAAERVKNPEEKKDLYAGAALASKRAAQNFELAAATAATAEEKNIYLLNAEAARRRAAFFETGKGPTD